MQNRQQRASLMTVEIPQPLHPAFKTTTKNRSPKIFKMALTIRKYKGELLSPRARRVAEKKLYKKVKTSPVKIMCRYSLVMVRIDASTCISFRIGVEKIMQIVLKIRENTTPESIVVLICRCRVS